MWHFAFLYRPSALIKWTTWNGRIENLFDRRRKKQKKNGMLSMRKQVSYVFQTDSCHLRRLKYAWGRCTNQTHLCQFVVFLLSNQQHRKYLSNNCLLFLHRINSKHDCSRKTKEKSVWDAKNTSLFNSINMVCFVSSLWSFWNSMSSKWLKISVNQHKMQIQIQMQFHEISLLFIFKMSSSSNWKALTKSMRIMSSLVKYFSINLPSEIRFQWNFQWYALCLCKKKENRRSNMTHTCVTQHVVIGKGDSETNIDTFQLYDALTTAWTEKWQTGAQ